MLQERRINNGIAVMSFDDLSLICSVDGQCWWQSSKHAKTHMSALFERIEPRSGDLLIEPIKECAVARAIKVVNGEVRLGPRFTVDTTSRGKYAGNTVRKPYPCV